MMKKILFLLLLIGVSSFGQKKLDKLLNKWNKHHVPYMSVDSLASNNTNTILLDARENEEYKVSHLENAVFVGFDHFNINKTLEQLPENKNTKIVVYCSLGIRSEIIAYQLIEKGYTNVSNLYGGIFKWKNTNYKVVDSLGKPTEKVHAYNKEWGKWLKKGEKVYH